MERRLFARAIDAQIHQESQAERRAFGLLMRRKIISILETPTEFSPDPYDYLIQTKGTKLQGEVKAGKMLVGFELEADDADLMRASEVSIGMPVLEEKMLIWENGEAEIQRNSEEKSFSKNYADIAQLMEYYGYLGLIESQLVEDVAKLELEELPPGILPFPRS